MGIDEEPDASRPAARPRGAHRRAKHCRADIPPEPSRTHLTRRALLRWLAVGTAFAAISGEEILRRSLTGETRLVTPAAVIGTTP
ncbi:hypothetical protein, partial [Kitasatospora putterlickiae]